MDICRYFVLKIIICTQFLNSKFLIINAWAAPTGEVGKYLTVAHLWQILKKIAEVRSTKIPGLKFDLDDDQTHLPLTCEPLTSWLHK